MDLNIGYFFILHGALYIAEFILSMIVVICLSVVSSYLDAAGVVLFTAIGCMISCFVFIIINLLNVPTNFSHIPWILFRFVVQAFWALFYFVSVWICVASADTVICYTNDAACTAAGIFSALALITCSWDAIIHFLKLRQRPNAQYPT